MLLLRPLGNHTRENPAHTARSWARGTWRGSCGGPVLLEGMLFPLVSSAVLAPRSPAGLQDIHLLTVQQAPPQAFLMDL